MGNQLFVVGLIVCVIIGLAVLEYYRCWKLKEKIIAQWASLPFSNKFDKEESLKDAWQKMKEYRSYDSEIDDYTWQDFHYLNKSMRLILVWVHRPCIKNYVHLISLIRAMKHWKK